jgi:hypothetical protein
MTMTAWRITSVAKWSQVSDDYKQVKNKNKTICPITKTEQNAYLQKKYSDSGLLVNYANSSYLLYFFLQYEIFYVFLQTESKRL